MDSSPLVRTEDGSLSLLDSATGELYHNRAGAFTEAKINYCIPSQGIETLARTGQLRILDACYGLGYNTLVLLAEAAKLGVSGRVDVEAVELDPQILRFAPEIFADPRFEMLNAAFQQSGILPSAFGTYKCICGGLEIDLTIHEADLRAHLRSVSAAPSWDFDIVFHDPFSPRKVPELWTADIFAQYHKHLKGRSGKFLTYSMAPAVLGGLIECGFCVYKTAPVGGKRGGTLALSGPDNPLSSTVYDLSSEERAKLATTSGIPYRDADLSDSRDHIQERRRAEQAAANVT